MYFFISLSPFVYNYYLYQVNTILKLPLAAMQIIEDNSENVYTGNCLGTHKINLGCQISDI